MAKGSRKHTGAGKVAKTARAISEKTGYKEGTVGDLAGTTLLEYKSEDKRLDAVKDVVKKLFSAKGKGTANDVVEPRAKHIISVLRKTDPKRYPAPEPEKKSEPKKSEKKAAKKETAKAAA